MRNTFGGSSKFVLAIGPPSSAAPLVRTLHELGAHKCLVLGHALDDQPDPDEAYWEDIAPELSASSTIESIWA